MKVVAGRYGDISYGETTRKDYKSGAAKEIVNMVITKEGRLRKRPAIKMYMSATKLSASEAFAPAVSRIGGMFAIYTVDTSAPSNGRPQRVMVGSEQDLSEGRLRPLIGAIDVRSFAPINSVGAIGEGASVGEWAIFPVAQYDGSPLMGINFTDLNDSHDSRGKMYIQIPEVVQNTTYRITIKRTNGKTYTLEITTPSQDFPSELNISDIPTVINGQPNPNYSQQVAARQTQYAQNRRNWVTITANQLTPSGIAQIMAQAFSRGTSMANPGNNSLWWTQSGDRSGLKIESAGNGLAIQTTDGSFIESYSWPNPWKVTARRVQTREDLTARGVPGQVVTLGRGNAALQANQSGTTWEEVPRARMSGGLSLRAMKINGDMQSGTSITMSDVAYGALMPRPTAAPVGMAQSIKDGGAVVKLVSAFGRIVVALERVLLVSAAGRPFDFFPESAVQPTAADGTVVDISQGDDEIIIDAIATRNGVFVMTTTGAYVVTITDATNIVSRKVLSTSFPPSAVHSIVPLMGNIWHYWRTGDSHSLTVYAESEYGNTWSHIDPIQQFALSSEPVPNRYSALHATPDGRMVYLVLDNRIKCLAKVDDQYHVTTMQQDAGEIQATLMSGNTLVICFGGEGQQLFVCYYEHTDEPGALDASGPVNGSMPVLAHAYMNEVMVPFREREKLPGAGVPICGIAIKSHVTLLPPLLQHISTPSSVGGLKDISVYSTGPYISIDDGATKRHYKRRSMMALNEDAWMAVHPVYRYGSRSVKIWSGDGEFAATPFEITAVTYRHTVRRDSIPSAME